MLLAAPEGQECLPCGSSATDALTAVERDLEEAFRTALPLPDCSGSANLQSCRSIEGLLTDAFESLLAVVRSAGVEETPGCLSCDPRPRVVPLAASLSALAGLLEEKGYADLAPSRRRFDESLEAWKAYRCCTADGAQEATSERPSQREADARAVLAEKCGPDFVDHRRGLRQVVRQPEENRGCFQSRACRSPTSLHGQLVEAGFWTYDGEYWYVWAERRTPRGEWVSCDP